MAKMAKAFVSKAMVFFSHPPPHAPRRYAQALGPGGTPLLSAAEQMVDGLVRGLAHGEAAVS